MKFKRKINHFWINFPWPLASVDFHHSSWNLGRSLLFVPELHDLEGFLQHQCQEGQPAEHVWSASVALWGRHLPLQVPDVGHSSLRCHDRHRIHPRPGKVFVRPLKMGFFEVGVFLQVSEGKWKWDDEIELEYTSAFFSGVYGMWNIYIFALIVLYSPSHKQWPQDG